MLLKASYIRIITVIQISYHFNSLLALDSLEYNKYIQMYDAVFPEMNRLNPDFEKVYNLFEEIRPFFKSLKNPWDYAYILDYQAYCQIRLEEYDSAEIILDQLFVVISNSSVLQCDSYLLSDYYYHKGTVDYALSNIDQAIYYFDTSINYLKRGEGGSAGPFELHTKLASCYYMIGDYKKSISYFKSALEDTSQSAYNAIKAKVYAQMSMSYLRLSNSLSAKKFMDIATLYSKDAGKVKSSDYTIAYLIPLSKLYLSTNELNKAKTTLDSIFSLTTDPFFLLDYYQIYGELELKLNNFNKAESYFLKGLELSQYKFPRKKYKLAETYLITSKSYLSANKINRSSLYNQYCLNTLIPNLKNHINIDPSKTLNHRLTVEALLLKAELQSKINDYKESKIAIKQALVYMDHMFYEKLMSLESRLFYVDKIKENFESIINVALENNDPAFAFEISQKMHGNILSIELFKEEVALKFNVPREYTDYVQSLNLRINSKVASLNRLDKLQDPISYDSLEADIDYFKGEMNSVLATIERKYPEYFKIKYSSPKINSVKNIQRNNLSNSSGLIEYFLAKNNLYTFIISKNDLRILKTKIDSNLFQQILKLNNSMRSLTCDFSEFTFSAAYLYNYLIKDAIESLHPSINKLYIIPDNELNYVPFEALINNIPISADNSRFDLLPYLVKDYSISYHYSSALLNNDNTSLSDNLTGYAPSFKSNFSFDQNLESLLHNIKEVLLIKNITNGQINVDTAATLNNLKESVTNYKIAHLATHATCNDTLPFESKIYLEDGPLHAYEIYNMPHNLDLAVLSACETGTGPLEKGEGLMSLARAFISSGCKSVITSLWNVNDKKSVDIMEYFYTHLYDGESVGESLTMAKRDYLNNVNSVLDAHPYHWATFIMIGNADMAIPVFSWMTVLSILVILIILSAAYLFIKKKNKTSYS